MEKVVVDAEGRVKLPPVGDEIVVKDQAGNTLAYVLPPVMYQRMMTAWLSSEPTPEELEEARKEYREKGGWTTAQVMEHLATVKRQWEEEKGK